MKGLDKCTGGILKLITDEMSEELLRRISTTEIKKVVFSLRALKAPRGDGLNSLFYHTHWDDIGQDMSTIVQCFFQIGELLEEVNKTQVVLIPKVHEPEKVSDFCPIICCNFIYKIISKIIVMRLKQLMLNQIKVPL